MFSENHTKVNDQQLFTASRGDLAKSAVGSTVGNHLDWALKDGHRLIKQRCETNDV